MKPLRTRVIVLAALAGLFSATACTAGSASRPATSAGSAGSGTSAAAAGGPAPLYQVSGTRDLTGNERSYGPSVGRIPGAVFQPDVVLIGGGADAIVGAQDNGLVWTVRGNAPGAAQLAVGKIMVATSFATGRVQQKRSVGNDVQVVLAPVALTDVFARLNVGSSTPIALTSPLVYSYANSPVTSTEGDAGVSAVPPSSANADPSPPGIQRIWGGSVPADTNPPGVPTVALPAPDITPKPVHEGKFTLTPYCCSPSQGVHIAYNEPTGRMAATVGIVMGSAPLVDFHIDIDAGGLEEAVLELNGPKAIEFQFDAATKDVSGNYRSPTLQVPFSFTFPIAGIPFTFTLNQSVHASIQLAGQASFSTKGQYAIAGHLGFAYRNKKFGADQPKFSSQISSLENASSLAVGINALSLGYGAHLAIGIGVMGFNGGPYFDVDATLAIDKDGSPTPTSLTAGCATAAVAVKGTFGVGYTIPAFVAKAVNTFLSLFNAKPIPASGGPHWGPYTLWDPGPGTRCLNRS